MNEVRSNFGKGNKNEKSFMKKRMWNMKILTFKNQIIVKKNVYVNYA